MRTYLSPIGYDTRRVTRPVINTGLGGDDRVYLLRPDQESDTERATQAVADTKQLLQEIEPQAECRVKYVSIDSFDATIQDCCKTLSNIAHERTTIVSLGGGARDILLPLTVAASVFAETIDTTLFFSDLDSTLTEWTLPRFGAQIPPRTTETFGLICEYRNWISLSEITDQLDQSKSTVIRHVNDLEEAGLVESDTTEKMKKVRVTLGGELLQLTRNQN